MSPLKIEGDTELLGRIFKDCDPEEIKKGSGYYVFKGIDFYPRDRGLVNHVYNVADVSGVAFCLDGGAFSIETRGQVEVDTFYGLLGVKIRYVNSEADVLLPRGTMIRLRKTLF